MDLKAFYLKGTTALAQPVWWLVFVIAYLGCMNEYGFLLGFGLGWIPSAMLATICAITIPFLWPLLVILIFYIAYALIN